jgi:CelD/BcsL family acetyltransferase involved in cellulose biosynthesis
VPNHLLAGGPDEETTAARSTEATRCAARLAPATTRPDAPSASAALEVDTICDAAGLERLSPGWDELVFAMPRPSPYLLHAWVTAWWHAFGLGADLRIHYARRNERLVGALPLCVRREHGLSVARFVGGADSALADVLVASDDGPETAARLADQAADEGCDLADLFGLPGHSRLAEAFGHARLTLVPRVAAPVLDLTRGWDATYAERVSAKHRKAHRRLRRQLGAQGELESRLARTPAEIELSLEEAFALHALRWRDRPDRSAFSSPAGRELHREAMPALAAADLARIVTLRLDGRAIAFTAFFVLRGTMILHRLAFDPAFGRWSPGLLATHDAVRAAAEEGVQRVEFLGGEEPYKLALADRTEPLYEGFGLARGARGRAAVAQRRAALAARRELAGRPRLRRAWYEALRPVRRVRRRLRPGTGT